MSLSGALSGPVFQHLDRLTDAHGLFEHALFAEPRPEHGYCVDDVARALVVLCRHPRPTPQLRKLAAGYLDFLLAAVQPDGTCHNRMRTGGLWTDSPGLGDWWGRALWGFGVAAAHGATAAIRAKALFGFRAAASNRSPHLRAMNYAALGAGELLLSRGEEPAARQLLVDNLAAVRLRGRDAQWPWPEPRMTYGNGSLVESVLLAGMALDDPAVTAYGLQLLDFLLSTETRNGHLSVTPVAGRGPGESIDAAFDQQPIEVAALADACVRAYQLTSDQEWLAGVRMAWAWFTGNNDAGIVMFDAATGAGFDGLHQHGRNENQGAESTLAMLSTAQHAHALAAR